MPDRDESQSFPWGWYVAMVACAAATGVAFGVSRSAGLVLVGVTALMMVSFVVWIARSGREARARGETPDLEGLRVRLRGSAKWLTVLMVATVLTSTIAFATNDGHIPDWLLISPPILLLLGVALTWLLVGVLLPRLQRQQANESD